MGLNRDFLRRKFGPVACRVTEKEIRDYAAAVGSANVNFYSGRIVAPPVFSVVHELPLLETVWKDPKLHGGAEEAEKNVLMLVHGSQDMKFHRLLRPGDEISFVATVTGIADKGSGELLQFSVTGTDRDSKPVVSSDWGLFVRGAGSGKGKKVRGGRPAEEREENPPSKLLFRKIVRLGDDVTRRYADASNDRNPVHLDEDVARRAGFSGTVVHGLCSMAVCADSIVDCYLDGMPERLKRLALRFSSPVYPGDTLAINGFSLREEKEDVVGFEVERTGDGAKVISGGLARVLF